MMKFVLPVVAVLAATSALAQQSSVPLSEFSVKEIARTSDLPVYPLVVFSGNDYAKELFRLEPGGCLRGPLVFRGDDGRDMFRLDAGATYPTGCMGN